jgi:hypothetical protein
MKRTVLFAVALLAACQTTTYEGDENSPYYLVPAGSRLSLHRDLVIPANQAGAFLQGGQVVPFAQLNPYQPHCKFEVSRVLDSPQTVRADEFVITKAVQSLEHSVRAPRRLAARSVFSSTDDGGPSIQTFATRLDLRSDRQPEVLRLTCGHWDYPPLATHLSIRQIRQALGEVFTLRIVPKPR